jgi:hypothetical protein
MSCGCGVRTPHTPGGGSLRQRRCLLGKLESCFGRSLERRLNLASERKQALATTGALRSLSSGRPPGSRRRTSERARRRPQEHTLRTTLAL